MSDGVHLTGKGARAYATLIKDAAALVQAGLADPVLDIDRLSITYPSNAELLDDLNAWRQRVKAAASQPAAQVAAIENRAAG